MTKQKLTEKERIENRRLKDKLRKRKQRERQKRQEEMQTDFLGAAQESIPALKKTKGTNPDHISRCPACGHYLPFCSCARDENQKLTENEAWLR